MNTNKNTKELVKELVKEYTEMLEKGTRDLFDSDKYKAYLKVASKFHNYSFNNTMLIFLQKPTATQVAGFSTWKKLKRSVIKGEKSIKIFAPIIHKYKSREVDENGDPIEKTFLNYRCVPVFDVAQTKGEALPQLAKVIFKDVNDYDTLLHILIQLSPVKVEFVNMDGSANGYYSEKENVIRIKQHLPQAQKIKTLIHEMSHSLLHCNGSLEDRKTQEVQAESVAFIVCQYLNIDTSDYSFGYIASWSENKELVELKKSMNIIQKTSNQIISQIKELA